MRTVVPSGLEQEEAPKPRTGVPIGFEQERKLCIPDDDILFMGYHWLSLLLTFIKSSTDAFVTKFVPPCPVRRYA